MLLSAMARTVLSEAAGYGHVIAIGWGTSFLMLDRSMPSVCAPGINQPLAPHDAACFADGVYVRCRATRRIPLWRYHSDDGRIRQANLMMTKAERRAASGLAFPLGQWWTPQQPGGDAGSGWEAGEPRAGLAIRPGWSDMAAVSRATMLVNGHFFYGRAAPQHDPVATLPGGWAQFFVLRQWLPWIDECGA